MIIILDNVRSMHNVGSVFRTADAIGAKYIYLCGITPTPLNEFGKLRPQVGKVSLGAENSVQWEKCRKTYRLIDNLKEKGYKIFVVEQHKNSIPYYKIKLSKQEKDKMVLVFGHEIKGLSKAVLSRADKILEIPMAGKKESLNVSVAFGIVAFTLVYNK